LASRLRLTEDGAKRESMRFDPDCYFEEFQ
jgi:hypothetical protein